MNNTLKKRKFKGKAISLVLVILILGIVSGMGIRRNYVNKGSHKEGYETMEGDTKCLKEELVLGSMVKERYYDIDELTDSRFNRFKSEEEAVEAEEDEMEEEELVAAEEEVKEEITEQPPVIGTRLNVGLISQLPDLYNGCEVTSLAMLLNYKGIGVSKMELADKMAKDSTAVVKDDNGNIITWGNPNVGFVGDVTGKTIGFSINPEPLIPLVNQYYSGGAVNLTGGSIEDLKASIDNNTPVLVWINENFIMPVEYMSWQDSMGNEIWANINTHTVLLTGYDGGNFYYNDPLYNYKDAVINFQTFEAVWSEMGRKAVTVN